MKSGDVLTVDIVDFGMDGEGVAKRDGLPIFIPYALKGERVSAKLTFVKKSFAKAEIVEILEQSGDRVKPKCPYFKNCGGCDIQHINHQRQLQLKHNSVKNCLKKIAGYDGKISDTVCGNSEWAYRNKLQLPFGERGGKVVAGFYKKETHQVVPIKFCPLHGEWAAELISIVLEQVNKYGLDVFDGKRCLLRHLVARKLGDSLFVVFVLNGKTLPHANEICGEIAQKFNNLAVYVSENTRDTNVILGDTVNKIYGEETLQNVGGLKVKVSPFTFLQVNNEVRDLIYDAVLNSLTTSQNIIIDAYSGAGILTAYLSQRAEQVYGIEIVPEATSDANELMRLNNATNVTNVCGDTAVELPKLVASLDKTKQVTIILDPPRKGCDEATLSAVLQAAPTQIIYISCNPATLARDLKYLTSVPAQQTFNPSDNVSTTFASTPSFASASQVRQSSAPETIHSPAYTITSVTPFDMFPQTKHIETLVCLARK